MNGLSDLFPKTRAEILHLLFETADQEIHLRDLARLAGLSVAAVQKELTSLASKGFVLTRRDGNRLYYRANTAHPLYPELHGLARKTSGISGELRRALATVEGIDLAFIFGSIAAGTHTSGSDVDLVAIGSAGLRKISAALSGRADSLGREINPVCLTATEWREKIHAGDAFATRVLHEPKLWLKGGPDELAAMAG
jgi:DNA-binding transcriptional ArsR family regulator